MSYDNSSWFSKLTYRWIDFYMWSKDKDNSILDDFKPVESMTIDKNYLTFKEYWRQEQQEGRPSLTKALWRQFKKEILLTGFFKLLWSAFMLLSAFFFVNSLLDWVKKRTDINEGIILAVFFFFSTFLLNIFQQMMNHIGNRVGCKMVSILQYEIYNKSCSLENISSSRAYVANLLSNDTMRVYEVCTQFHILYSAPIETIIIISLLIWLIGWSGFIALAIMIMIVPILVFTGQKINDLRVENVKNTDKRLSIIQEAVNAVKLIKFYSWESFFLSNVNHIRKAELQSLKVATFIKAMSLQLVFIIPPLIAFLLFITYVQDNSKLDAKLAFTTLSLFNTLRFPLVILPKSIKAFSEFVSSISRIQSFLVQPDLEEMQEEKVEMVRKKSASMRSLKELNSEFIIRDQGNDESGEVIKYVNVKLACTVNEPSEIARIISQAYKRKVEKKRLKKIKEDMTPEGQINKKKLSIRFDSFVKDTLDSTVVVLEDLNLSIKKGEKVAIVGPVGCGKSTLLKSFLGQVRVMGGKMRLEYNESKIAYVPQFPWIFSGTVRENILLNNEYKEDWYKQTIFGCALVKDLQDFRDGDMHVISEKGANLSGGQRQRLGLCRAVYRNYDHYFLDAPLAAVDYATGQHIFNYCFKGMLREKTVVMVTHQMHLLNEFDKVIILKDKSLVYIGPYDKKIIDREFPQYNEGQEADEALIKKQRKVTEVILNESFQEGIDEEVSNKINLYKTNGNQNVEQNIITNEAEVGIRTEEIELLDSNRKEEKKQQDVPIQVASHDIHLRLAQAGEGQTDFVKRALNQIRGQKISFFGNFSEWARSGGIGLFFLMCFVYGITQTTRIISDQWVNWWTNDKYGHSMNYYALMYGLLVLIFGIFLLCRGTSFHFFTISSSYNIHSKTIAQLLCGSFYFFQKTAQGKILENFSKDQDTIDYILPDIFQVSFVYCYILATTTIIVCITLPIYTVVIAAMVLAVVLFVGRFTQTCYELKGLNRTLSADLISYVSETLEGISIVKCYNSEKQCKRKLKEIIDYNQSSVFLQSQVQLWLAFRFDFVGSLLILTVSLIVVFQDYSASAAGLAISNAFQSLIFLTWVIKGYTDVSINLESVQNMKEYFSIEDEPLLIKKYKQQTKNAKEHQKKVNEEMNKETSMFLTNGEIEFQNACLSYDKKNLVLKNLSIKIKAGEKVGIVGRTGAGKSSVIMALFRLFKLESGTIFVDGKDISQVKLEVLRKSMSVLPQDSLMFQSSFRSNLDPLNEYTDEEIWNALDKCFLKQAIESLPNKLDTIVEEGGKNFSLGQKQLVCLGRALLKKSKILVLDEATASMDLETDKKLQIVLDQEFKGVTRLTIAHRIDTVAESDKIAVLQLGELMEFDTPYNLINNPQSLFYQYVMLAGDHAQSVIEKINSHHQNQILQH